MSYPYDASTLAAITRLGSYYNGNNYNAGSNPGGMGAGGHRTNFIPSLQDLATVADSVSDAADSASTSASNASTSETNAAASAAKLSGTSTTSVSIGTGAKTFTTQASKFFNVGTFVNVRSAANPTTNYMLGQVTAYSSTTLTVNVSVTSGSGSYTDWTIDVAGSPGQTGATGSAGARGSMPAIQQNFSNGTTDSDPGNGLIKFSTATFSALTTVYLDNLDLNGADITAWIDSFDDSTNTSDRGFIYFTQVSDDTKWAIVKVSGAVTDGTGYRKVAVTPISCSSASIPFTNGSALGIFFNPAGDKGADGGGAGDTISDISSVTDGRLVLFSGTTGKHITNASVGFGTSGANVGALNGTNTWSGVQSHAAKVDIQQDFAFSGDITPAQISANTDDYAPAGNATASVFRLSTDASRNLTGIANGADGRILILMNVGSFDIVLKNLTTSSSANQFSLGGDVTLGAGQNIWFMYDATATKWKPLSNIGLGADGSVSRPFYSFGADTDTGIYRIGANNIGVAVNGAKVLDVSTTGLAVTGTTLGGDGTVSLPSFAFSGDTDSGMYRIGANNVGVAVNGAKVLDISTSGLDVTGALTVGGAVQWTTGDAKLTFKTSADTGWILCDDGSIGDGSSSATTRANADTSALFTLLYNNISTLVVQDSSGSTVSRGASASADFAAHRRLVIPKTLGRSLAIAGAGSGLTSRSLGTTAGAETETPTTSKTAAHNHGPASPGVNFIVSTGAGSDLPNGGGGTAQNAVSTTANTGSGTALNILDPSFYINVMIKL